MNIGTNGRYGTDSARFVAVAVGDRHGLALSGDGSVVSWGDTQGTPERLTGIAAIAAGRSHSLGLKRDGTVVAWGRNDKGQVDVPVGLSGVVSIAAGQAHNLALRSDGSVVAWGFNDAGQTDVPPGLMGVKAIAAGWWHSLALRGDGSVVAWGHADSDQRHVPHGLVGAISISAGYENSSAIFPDGSVIDWGNDTNFFGVPDEFHDVTSIAYGYRHRLALRRDGSVASDGFSFGGIPVPETLADVVAIAGGQAGASSHFLALTRDGTIVGLGTPGINDDPVLDLPAQRQHRESESRRWWRTKRFRLDRKDRVQLQVDDASSAGRPERGRSLPTGVAAVAGPAPSTGPGKTALMHWAAVEDEDRVEELLDEGADINAVDEDGDCVLRYAMGTRNPRIFELLLSRGADANARSTSAAGLPGFTILHATAELGWSYGISALARHGARVEARGAGGVTAMMLAAGGGWDDVVIALHSAGADVNATDDDGDSVLYYATSRGRGATTKQLLKLGASVNPSQVAPDRNPLLVAATLASPAAGHRPAETSAADFTRVAVELLRAGADASTMYDAGYALQRHTSRGVEIAPADGVSRAVAAHDDWSIVYLAPGGRARLSWVNRAEEPEPSLAAVRARLQEEYSSFDTARREQRAFESRSLIGEFYAITGQYGLHYARTGADVLLLLRDGAPIDGVALIDYEDGAQHFETPLLTALVDERREVAHALMRAGADVDAPNGVFFEHGGFGHSALHMMVQRRDYEGTRTLIAAGADVNRQTTLGSTPLYFAASIDDPFLVRNLLDAGARAMIRDLEGGLPADVAGPRTRDLLA